MQLTNPGEVGLVLLDVGQEMAHLQGLQDHLSGSGVGMLGSAYCPKQVPFFPRVCFLKLALLNPLGSQEREKSQLELLQWELSPSPTKAKTECIYQMETPV